MKYIERATRTGHLLIRELGTGKILVDKKNIIVQEANYAYLLGLYEAYTTSPITTLQLGTGGTLDAAGLIPIIPEASQEQLNNYLLTLPTSAPAPVSSDTSITFSANLLTTQGNGAGISEGALFTASGVMFNYLTFPAIQKTPSFGINFQWTIST